jgi:flagella basal body P-ring formation protein FlgA
MTTIPQRDRPLLAAKALLALLLGLGLFIAEARAQGADPGRTHVRVLPNPHVNGETYTLGEIAELDGFDIKLLKELAALEIGRSPLPGRSMRLNDGMVRTRLRRVIDEEQLVLIVPDRAEVTRAALRVAGAEIEELVLARAAAESGTDPDDLRQELSGTIPDIVLPKGELEWQVEPLGRNIASSGERTYLIVARVNGQDAWRTTVRLKQKVYEQVVVAANPLRRNQVIEAQDVKVARRPLAGADPARVLGSLEEVVGKQARRPIGANERIQAEMLVEPPAVEEGGRVFVVYRTPRVILEVPGVALVNGHLGEFIPVKNLQSGKIVYGVIESGNTVRVN